MHKGMVGVLQNGTTKPAHGRPIPKPGGEKDVGEQARTNHSREKVEDAQLVSHITCKQVKVMHVMLNPEG